MGKDPRSPGSAWLIPYLTVRNAEKSLEFYEKAFGFQEQGKSMRGPDGSIQHAGMTYQGQCMLMFSPEGSMGCSAKAPATSRTEIPINLYVYHPDPDSLQKQAKAAGAKVIMEASDQFWGDRITVVEDPDGYRWTFAKNVGEFDESKIPAAMKAK